MGERAVLDKGMETLAAIGQSDSTTFVLPQELTSLVGRYGKHLAGSDVAATDGTVLDSLDFDADTRELLGIDDIETTLDQLTDEADMDVDEMEQEAESITDGDAVDINDPDAVIEEMDAQGDGGNPEPEPDPNPDTDPNPTSDTDTDTATPDAADERTTEDDTETGSE